MAETGGVPPGEVGGWIAAAGAVLAIFGGPKAFGKAVEWLDARAERKRLSRADGNREWEGKLDRREAELAAREAQLAEKLAAGLEECRAHCAAVEQAMATVREDHRIVLLVVKVALPKLAAVAADSAEMGVIRTLLATRYPPVDPHTPDDMNELLRLLDPQPA